MKFRYPLIASLFAVALLCVYAAQANSRPANRFKAEELQLPALDMAKIELKAGHIKPLIVLVADNLGTETTDLLIPFGVLKAAGKYDVSIVSTQSGSVTLMPALKIQADMTIAEFAAAHPEGPDVVIVPALHQKFVREINDFLRKSSAQKAFILSICVGARIVAKAGLFHKKRATTHWYAMNELAETYQDTQWVDNRRYIRDGNLVSTTGVSASIPATLYLISVLSNENFADEMAKNMGFDDWSDQHDTALYQFDADFALTIAGNATAFWTHEKISIPVKNSVDEISLALQADAWARTYRSTVSAVSRKGTIVSRNGVKIFTELEDHDGFDRSVMPLSNPGEALHKTLLAITKAYGEKTAGIVRDQLEFP